MSTKNYDFKTTLVTGAGGGIEKPPEATDSRRQKVIIVGRTEATLESTAKEIGATA